jgi:hypothetical protein
MFNKKSNNSVDWNGFCGGCLFFPLAQPDAKGKIVLRQHLFVICFGFFAGTSVFTGSVERLIRFWAGKRIPLGLARQCKQGALFFLI